MHKLLLGALAASTMLSSVPQARTQEANEAVSATSDSFFDRIVVSAGEEKVAIDTPQAVSVVTQEDIDDIQPDTVGDVFRDIPGVSTVGSERILGESFNIRGIGSASASDESKIIVQVDGVPKFYEQYRMGSLFLDPELLKRVEVLRGPASSTLYGSGAFGGVITMTTKDASDFIADGDSWAIKTKVGVSSNGLGATPTVIAAKRFNESFEALAAGTFRVAGDYRDGNGDRVVRSGYESFSGLLNTKFRFGDANEQYLRASFMQFYNDETETEYNQTGGGGFGQTDRKVVDRNIALEYGNPFSDNKYFDVKANFGFTDTQNEQTNLTNGSVGFFGNSANYGYRTYIGKVENTADLSVSDSFEHNFITGAEISHQERTADRTIGGATAPISFQPEGTQVKIAGYAQSEIYAFDRLTVIPGLRYEHFQSKGTAATSNASKNLGAFSPKLAALFALNDNISVFGSVSYTERAPTLDELYSTSSSKTVSLQLEPEQSKNFEAGISFKYDGLFTENDRLRAKITGFHNDITNLIESSTGPTYYHNVGKARIQGVEIEGSYTGDIFFARLGYAHIHGDDTANDVPLNSIPGDTLTTTLGFRLPDHNLKLQWNAEFTAGQERVSGRKRRTGGYGVHGISGSWTPDEGTLEGFDVRFGVENILDRDYRRHLSDDPAKGRTFKLTLAKTFGG